VIDLIDHVQIQSKSQASCVRTGRYI